MILSYTAIDGNTSLQYVRAKVYDITTGTPSLVGNYSLTHVKNGTYEYFFTTTLGKKYIANIAVYTDNTYTALNGNYTPEDDEGGNNQTVLAYTAYDGANSTFPQATVYDMTTGSPVLVGIYNFTYLIWGTYYCCLFQANPAKEYMVQLAAYTDATYSTLDSNHPPTDVEIEKPYNPYVIQPSSAVEGPVDAAIDGLVAYLQGVVSGLTVLTEWPYGNQKLTYPSLTVFSKKPKRTPIQPETLSVTSPNSSHQITQTMAVAHYDIPIQLDLWCRTKAERRQYMNAILSAFNQQENTGDAPSGLSLELTNYFNIYARYEIDTHEFKDDERAAEIQERRCMINLLVNTREVVQKTVYAIVHTTVYQETVTDEFDVEFTDDATDTEAKEYF